MMFSMETGHIAMPLPSSKLTFFSDTLHTSYHYLHFTITQWFPNLGTKDIAELEKVQKRATQMMTGLGHLPYEEKLQYLGLFSLEKRGDMIKMYKI